MFSYSYTSPIKYFIEETTAVMIIEELQPMTVQPSQMTGF